VGEGDVLGGSILVVDAEGDLRLGGKSLDADEVDKVGGLDLLVVGGVLEVEL
jgi:hypothetical protein